MSSYTNDLRIITNNNARALCTYNELPDNVRDDFDYMKNDSRFDEMREYDTRFFKYKGAWYDANEFTSTKSLHDDRDFKAWDGYHGDTYYSGVLIKYVNNEQDFVRVARYCY